MIHGTRSARALALVLLTTLGVVLAAAPALAGSSTPALSGVVNVNTATAEQLQMLPGIGEARAQALIAMRKELGGFKTVEQLMDVKGIGPSALERLRPFVRVTGKTTAQIR